MTNLYPRVFMPFNIKQKSIQAGHLNNQFLQLFSYFLYPVTEELSWKLILNSNLLCMSSSSFPMRLSQEGIAHGGT